MFDRLKSFAILFCALYLISAGSASALPGDVDMFSQESLRSNEVARSPSKGTVPVGFQPFTMTIEEAETKLQNPVPKTFHSVWRGQRLWNSTCSACHGLKGNGKTVTGPLLGVPDITGDFYKTKTDGRIFAVIHHGLRAMPRYGFRLSADERWDVINYLRFLQGADVPGMTRSSN